MSLEVVSWPARAVRISLLAGAVIVVATLIGLHSAAATATGQTVAGGNGEGSSANQLLRPRDVAVDETGNLFVADQGNARVQKWAPGANEGVTVAGGNGIGSAANQVDPMGIALDAEGNLYVADWSQSRVQKWAPGASQGVTVAGGNGYGAAANQLSQPSFLTLDIAGNLYVADAGNDRVQRWSPGASEGVTVAGGNGRGAALNQLYFPAGVQVNSVGDLFVADYANNRVVKWSAGAAVGAVVVSGVNQVIGIDLDPLGNLFLTAPADDRVEMWAPGASVPLTAAGGNGRGSGAEQLSFPNGLALDSAGHLFVADYDNDRVQRWTLSDTLPTTTTTTTTVPPSPAVALRLGDLSVPEGSGPNELTVSVPFAVDRPIVEPLCIWYRTESGAATGSSQSLDRSGAQDFMMLGDPNVKYKLLSPPRRSGSIALRIFYDAVEESNEDFALVLWKVTSRVAGRCDASAPVHPQVRLVRPTGVITLIDDDTPTLLE